VSPTVSPGTFAVVPVKRLADAKRRLAPALAPVARGQLVLTMLDDVLGLLAGSEVVNRIVVVTADDQLASLARHRSAHVIGEDKPYGLNAAIRSGLAFARSQGAKRALVLPADLPLATSSELIAILEWPASAAPHAVIVPSSDSSGTGEGTNALLLSPPDAMQPEFGPDSFVRHVAQAVALGLDFRVLRLPGFSADIDEPRDLARLTGERYAFLRADLSQPEREA